MSPVIAVMLLRGSADDWGFVPVLLIFVAVSVVWRKRPLMMQWWNNRRGRDWMVATAVIDVVSVVAQTEQTRYGERVTGYLGTLTYFFRNPELQMGEYFRLFDEESEAQAWADSYKGSTVVIRVDPRDPTRSVLRKEDL